MALGPRRPADRGFTRALVVSAVVSGTAVTGGLLAEAVTNPVYDFDGVMTWTATARFIRAERTVDAAVLREERWSVSHPAYPVLMPLAQVTVLETFNGPQDERIVRPLYALFVPAFLLVLFDTASRFAGRAVAAATALAASLLPFLALHHSGGAGGTYSDLPLGAFWGAGLLLLLEAAGSLSTGIAAGLLLGAGCLTKNEGAPLALVALAAGSVAAISFLRRGRLATRRRLGSVAFAAMPVAAAIVLLVSWRADIVNRNDEMLEVQLRSRPVLADTLVRLPLLLRPIVHEMKDWEAWRGFWLAAAVVMLAGIRGVKRRPLRPLIWAVAGALAAYAVAYGVSPWDPRDLVPSTWNRFLVQLALPLLVLLAASLRECLRVLRSPHSRNHR